jgi:hypothetical protein
MNLWKYTINNRINIFQLMQVYKQRIISEQERNMNLGHYYIQKYNNYVSIYAGVFEKYNDRKRSKCEFVTIIQSIIYSIFSNYACIYTKCSNRSGRKYEFGTILQSIIYFICFKLCSCIYK